MQTAVNIVESYKEIMRLQRIKLKNEAALSQEELQGKYRASYEKLCENIKQMQNKYRTECTKVIRNLADVLDEMAYMEPTDEGYDHMYDVMADKSQVCGNDPLFVGMLGTITEKFKERKIDNLKNSDTRTLTKKEIIDRVEKLIGDQNYMINSMPNDDRADCWEYAREHLKFVLRMLLAGE